jgi:hypothetical protein
MKPERTLVLNCEDGFIGWFITKKPSFTGEGEDVYCRPLGLNPFATYIIRNVSTKFTKFIDKSKIMDAMYNLLIIMPRSRGVVTDALIELNADLAKQVEELTEKLKVETGIAKTKELKTKMDMKSELQSIIKMVKSIRPREERRIGGE